MTLSSTLHGHLEVVAACAVLPIVQKKSEIQCDAYHPKFFGGRTRFFKKMQKNHPQILDICCHNIGVLGYLFYTK